MQQRLNLAPFWSIPYCSASDFKACNAAVKNSFGLMLAQRRSKYTCQK